ncbi:MAG: hypothetical protein M3A44_09825 [Gammaproteobacteria bacterium]
MKSISPKGADVVLAKGAGGENYRASLLSKDKHCFELTVIRDALSANGIKYMEKKDHVIILRPKSVKSEDLANALREINLTIESSAPLSRETRSPVDYIMYEDGQIGEHTTANYSTGKPRVNYPILPIGFDLFVATNLGLRAYYIERNGTVVSEGGDYNTAFYSVAGGENDPLLVSAPGHRKIYVYDKLTGRLSVLIDGYAATKIKQSNGKLFFVGYKDFKDWNKAALYEYTFSTKRIRRLTAPIFSDVRGLEFGNGELYVSDGGHNRIVVLDTRTYRVRYYWLGFTYPNGISLTDRDTLLVADEHAGVIRELDPQTGQEVRSIGYRLLRFPGHVEEITTGPYKGAWLIADTGNDRVLLLDPSTEKIYAEISGLREPLDFVVFPKR